MKLLRNYRLTGIKGDCPVLQFLQKERAWPTDLDAARQIRRFLRKELVPMPDKPVYLRITKEGQIFNIWKRPKEGLPHDWYVEREVKT